MERIVCIMNKISVVLPTYNRANIIGKSIESVLNQTYQDLELIIVDDGSTDNTEAVVNVFKDNRIRYHKMDQNGGVSMARNIGVALATYDLVALEDSDDIWSPTKLEKQMQYWNLHPEFNMVYCPYEMELENKRLVTPSGLPREELEGNILSYLLLRNSIGAPTVLFKKQAFLECGGFDPEFKSLEDWDFAIRFAKKNQIGFFDEVLVRASHSTGGISSGFGAYYESRCRLLAKHRNEIIAEGLFDTVVLDIFNRAEQAGILDVVKKLLFAFMQS